MSNNSKVRLRGGSPANMLCRGRARSRAIVESLEPRILFSGTWTALSQPAPGAVGTMLLLTDGSVIAQTDGAAAGSDWARLTPTVTGSYVDGTWTKIANSNDTRLYDASVVMQNGNVFVAGGEYGTGGSNGEIYNPQTNTWTRLPAQSFGNFSDAYATLIANGNVLAFPVGPSSYGHTTVFNPNTNTWSQGPQYVRGGSADEQSWLKLADGSILTIDGSSTSERYIPASNSFVDDGTVPDALSDSLGEYGPAFLLANGKAIFFGANGRTAIYTPSGSALPGSWVAGPSVPGGLGLDDASGAVLRDGTVVITAGPIDSYNGPTSLFLYDPAANSFSALPGPNANGVGPFETRMLVLPNGNLLYSQDDNTIFQYDPGTSALAAAAPTIKSVTPVGDGSLTLTGTGLTGINTGAGYGDDAQMDSNYPIIRLTSGGNVYYARSYNWSSTGVQSGPLVETVNFTLPVGIAPGTYALVVTANGVASLPVSLTVSTTANNAAPTITGPAGAAAGNVTGTSTVLSVLGSDNGGEANLVYTWMTLTAPGTAALPSYSVNGSNAAKNTTVTFHQAGTYTFAVTLTDAGGLSVTSGIVSVVVTTTLSSVSVSPTEVNLSTGQTQQLNATGFDQFGVGMFLQPAFTWAIASGGGSITPGGLYTAPATGTVAMVTATSGTLNGTAEIGVVRSPWTSADIGSPSLPGAAYDLATTTVVNGSGNDIWNNADQFHFDYQTLNGDGGISAEISVIPTANVDGTSLPAAKAGVMYRDSTAEGASFVGLVYTNGAGLQMLYRNGTGAIAGQQGATIAVSGPLFVKLLRAGSTFTGYYSQDGIAWTLVGSYTNAAVGTGALAGLVACSHDSSKLATVTYSNVSINPGSAALSGDINGDNHVNIDDYLLIDLGYLRQLSGFGHGDLNTDGSINAADYRIIDAGYKAQHPTGADVTVSSTPPGVPLASLAGSVDGVGRRAMGAVLPLSAFFLLDEPFAGVPLLRGVLVDDLLPGRGLVHADRIVPVTHHAMVRRGVGS